MTRCTKKQECVMTKSAEYGTAFLYGTGPQHCGSVATLFPTLRSTFYPNLKQIGKKMTELLNGRHFEAGAAGNGTAAPHTAPQCCGGVATSFPILQSTFFPNLKQIGQKMTELLNGHQFEDGATGNGAAAPRTASQRSGDIPSRCPIPRSSFVPNWGQFS